MELLFLAVIAVVLLLGLTVPFALGRRSGAAGRKLARNLTLEEAVLAHEWTLSSLANAYHLEREQAEETIRRQVEVASLLYEAIASQSGKRLSRTARSRYRRRLLERALAEPRARSLERRKLLEPFAANLSVKEPENQGHAQAVVVEMLRAVA